MAFHDIAAAILWILSATKALARAAVAVALSSSFEVSQHIILGEKHMSTCRMFSSALGELVSDWESIALMAVAFASPIEVVV